VLPEDDQVGSKHVARHIFNIYRVIHKSVKHLKNSQQRNYASGHDNSYANRERKSSGIFKESPRAELP
jgi:hypothetical protein